MISAPDPASTLIFTVFRLNGRLIEAGDGLVAGVGLTTAWWQVLGVLSVSPVPLPAAHIARIMGLSRQAVQRTADLLAKNGLVRFEANPHHQRAKLVVPTKQGIAAVSAAKKRQRPWARNMTADLAVEEIETALRVLNHMDQYLTTTAVKGGDNVTRDEDTPEASEFAPP